MNYILIGDIKNSLEFHISSFKDNANDYRLSCQKSINIQSFGELKKNKGEFGSVDIIIINLDNVILESQYKNGIDILKYLRFGCEITTKIIVLSFTEITDQIANNATNSILIAPNNNFLQLPIQEKKLEHVLYNVNNINDINELKKKYYPFVFPDFHFEKFNHTFANSYGLYVMEKFYKEFFAPNDYNLTELNENEELDFTKADFLFKHSSSNKRQKERLKSAFQNINIVDKHIAHIDDENRWYKLFRHFLGDSYNPINEIFTDGESGTKQINKVSILNQLNNINNGKLDLILIDLRLLGDSENDKPLVQLSGANLIKFLRQNFDESVPILLVSATDRLKNMSTLQNYPFNVNYFWQKPRVDKGKLNLILIYEDLFSKIDKALKLYTSPIEKIISKAKYNLKEEQSKFSELPQSLVDYDYYIFDTNFFCETTSKLSNHHISLLKLYKALENTDKRIILIHDVLTELILNSIKDGAKRKKLRASSSFSQRILKKYLKSNYFVTHNSQVDQAVNNSLIKGLKENKIEKHWEVIYSSFAIEENFDKKSDAHKFIELSKNKTLLHADRTFKYLIKYQLEILKKKILFISDDKGCKYGIAKQLDFGDNPKEFCCDFCKDEKGKEYIRYNIPDDNEVTITKGAAKVSMVKNDVFCGFFNE